ncbi:MAG: DUF1810 domain-containing protein [Blautia sp.]
MRDRLERFIEPQEQDYEQALKEIRNGRKVSHWIWYIFPQLRGLGKSYMSDYYGIRDLDEAKAFLQDPYLGKHLQEISEALLNLDNDNATQIMGRPDDMKLKSSMTLFACADPENAVFEKVLEKFYNGHKDGRTLKMLSKENG